MIHTTERAAPSDAVPEREEETRDQRRTPAGEGPQWGAVLTYGETDPPCRAGFAFADFDELAAVIAAGPDWRTITRIEVTLVPPAEDPAPPAEVITSASAPATIA